MTHDLQDEYDLAYAQRQHRRAAAAAAAQAEIADQTAEQEIARSRRRTSWKRAAEIRVAAGLVVA